MISSVAFPNILTFPLGGAQRELRRQERAGFDERVTLMPQVAAGGIYGGTNAGAAGVKEGAAEVTSNWWEAGGATGCVEAHQPKGAASYAASKVNLNNPGTNDITDDAQKPSWDAADGWTFNGSTNYLIGDSLAAQKPVTFLASVNLSTISGIKTIYGGNAAGSLQFRVDDDKLRFVKQGLLDIWLASSSGGIAASTVVVVGGTYSSSGVVAFFVNGSKIVAGTNDTTLVSSIVLIGVNGAGGGAEYFNGKMHALAKYDNVLTDDQIAAITTAMAAL